MPTEPDPKDAQALARELVSGMSQDEMQAFIAAIRGHGLLDPGPPAEEGPGPVELPDELDPPPLLRVRVDLDGAKPAVWRRLELRGDLTVAELHDVLQAAMGWTDSHLHRFWLGPAKRLWSGPYLLTDWDVHEGEVGTHEVSVELSQLLRGKGDRLFYTYDFGDGWDHTLKVEAVLPCPDDQPAATCTGGRNACPPEDVGGTPAHNELVAAYREAPDRSTMDEMYVDWLPEGWDPFAFDVAEVNHALALVGADPEDALAVLGGPDTMHPALSGLLGRLPRQMAVEHLQTLAALATAYPGLPDGVTLPADRLREAVHPWQLLLDLAGDDGIPLTAAGWMKPAVVQQIHADLRLDRSWIGRGNREDYTVPVALLREVAMELGLLRRFKGRLVRTPRGRAVAGDSEGLWRHLAARAVTGDDYSSDDAAVALLLLVAQGRVSGWDLLEDVAEVLGAAGWPTRIGQAGRAGVRAACRPAYDLLAQLGGGSAPEAGDPELQRAFAAQVLLGASSAGPG